jgi:hypothetical protein
MQYWKRIEMQNWEVIAAKTLDYIKEYTKLLDRTSYKGPFNSFNTLHYLEKVPEIQDACKKYGLHYETANVYVMWSNEHSFPHKDYTDSIARINLPILNCAGSSTVFYKGLKGRRMVLSTGSPFYLTVDRKNIEQVDVVEIDQPTIIRVSEGHDVILPENPILPRISLTISTAPDVGLLLDD